MSQVSALTNYPELASNLCTSAEMPYKFDNLFRLFADNLNSENMQGTIKFWLLMQSSDKMKLIEDEYIIKNWMKCCIYSHQQNDSLNELTRFILTLNEIKQILGESNLHSYPLIPKFPLIEFLQIVGTRYSELPENSDVRILICDRFRMYFRDFDKWVDGYMIKSKENTITVYKVLGKIIHTCSPIIHSRMRPDCFFDHVMNKYILLPSLLMGRTPEITIIQSVHLIWPMILDGISKLDFKRNEKLKKCISDMIIKWTPHFKLIVSIFLHSTGLIKYNLKSKSLSQTTKSDIIAKPLILVANLCSSDIISEMYEKLMSNFIKLQQRQSHPLSCFIVTILIEIFKSIKEDHDKMKILLENTAIELLDHAMKSDDVVPSKRIILEFLDAIFNSLTYRASQDLKDIFCSALKTLTKNNLSYYATFLFQYVISLIYLL